MKDDKVRDSIAVTYAYTVNDTRYENARFSFNSGHVGDIYRLKESLKVGHSINIWYNPTNPQQSSYDRSFPIDALIFILVSLAIMATCSYAIVKRIITPADLQKKYLKDIDPKKKKETTQRRRFLKIYGSIFLIVNCLWFFQQISLSLSLPNWVQTEAIISGKIVTIDEESPSDHIQVFYSYNVSGSDYESDRFEFRFSEADPTATYALLESLSPQDKINIWYNPEEPQESSYDISIDWLDTIIFIPLFSLFSSFFFYLFIYLGTRLIIPKSLHRKIFDPGEVLKEKTSE